MKTSEESERQSIQSTTIETEKQADKQEQSYLNKEEGPNPSVCEIDLNLLDSFSLIHSLAVISSAESFKASCIL